MYQTTKKTNIYNERYLLLGNCIFVNSKRINDIKISLGGFDILLFHQ